MRIESFLNTNYQVPFTHDTLPVTMSKKSQAVCPSCGIQKHRTELRLCLEQMEARQKREFGHHPELTTDAYEAFLNASFEWACDDCLKSKQAILAKPGAQETAFDPHLAYSDKQMVCYRCEQDFKFRKEEKQAWYESYKLPIHAEPDHCLACRRAIRQEKLENKSVSEILKKAETSISKEELESLIQIYSAWDKTEKVKYFEAMLRKRIKQED